MQILDLILGNLLDLVLVNEFRHCLAKDKIGHTCMMRAPSSTWAPLVGLNHNVAESCLLLET